MTIDQQLLAIGNFLFAGSGGILLFAEIFAPDPERLLDLKSQLYELNGNEAQIGLWDRMLSIAVYDDLSTEEAKRRAMLFRTVPFSLLWIGGCVVSGLALL